MYLSVCLCVCFFCILFVSYIIIFYLNDIFKLVNRIFFCLFTPLALFRVFFYIFKIVNSILFFSLSISCSPNIIISNLLFV